MSYNYDQDNNTALEAITKAQKIAFAPMLFQAVLSLRDNGILSALDQAGEIGLTVAELSEKIALSPYAIQLLLDVALGGEVILQKESKYSLAKVGHFLLHDTMTKVNMNFTQDVCYQGLHALDASLKNAKPEGLKVFTDGPTIYPYLNQLPEPAKTSWFEFDHFYSDRSFKEALLKLQAFNPLHIYDVGGNTGKFALQCCRVFPNTQVTLLDLPEQIQLAQNNEALQPYTDRIHFFPVDMLSDTPLPAEADLWWMSQFLDCFSEAQIVLILSNIYRSIQPGTRVCILELFWNNQSYEAGAFSLNASSLYFTAIANGYSRFYSKEAFLSLVQQAGFRVEQLHENLGMGHTLVVAIKD